MALDYVYGPLASGWPIGRPRTPADQRIKATFKAKWDDTANFLDYEIRKLGATNCMFLVDVDERDVRLDGALRAGVTVRSPAVVVTFSAGKLGAMKMPADGCTVLGHNVRAVAYHLEHLRLSSLYGVGRLGEQYAGWKQLPDQRQLTAAMTVEQAALAIANVVARPGDAKRIVADATVYRAAYREGAAKTHPDRGGEAAAWNTLQEAKRVLEAHHGGGGANG